MPLVALVLVTAVWGITFVQVKDAVAIYPLFAFLAVRYAIATGVLGIVGVPRVRSLGRPGLQAGAVLGGLLGIGVALQTAGLERTTVSSTGFITGLYVVLTPLFGLALFRIRVGVEVWAALRSHWSGWPCSPASTPARRSATCSCSPPPPRRRCRS